MARTAGIFHEVTPTAEVVTPYVGAGHPWSEFDQSIINTLAELAGANRFYSIDSNRYVVFFRDDQELFGVDPGNIWLRKDKYPMGTPDSLLAIGAVETARIDHFTIELASRSQEAGERTGSSSPFDFDPTDVCPRCFLVHVGDCY
jgi:hypothetical protein